MSAATPEPTAPTTPAAPAAPSPAEAAGFAPLKAVPAAPAAPAATPAPAWTEGLSADDKAFLASKGWDKEGKGVGDIIKGYRNAERLRGVEVDKLVRLPDWSKPEEVAEYRARIGVPETHEAYESHEVQLPTGMLDASMIAKLSHRIGADPLQHKELLNGAGELITELFQAENEALGRKRAVELQDLAKEIGPAKLPEFNQAVESALAQFKDVLPPDLIDGISTFAEAPFRKFLAAVGRALGEHNRPSNAQPNNVLMTADVAKARMAQLRGDRAWMDAHGAGDTAKRQEWEELQRVAFGG